MPRIRTIKPEMAQDEDLASVSIEAQLLAVRILNHADDEGYFKANPALIKANCFPLIDSVNATVLLRELSEIGYIRLAEGSDGKQYGKVVNFSAHQTINKPKESKIKGLVTFTDEYGSDTVLLPGGKERKGKERKEPMSESAIPPCPHSDLINLYHETLPELQSVLLSRWPGSSGERLLKTRWRENKQHQNLDFWRGFFRAVRTNPHWMGHNARGWRADLRWLIKRENFDKVVERWANGAAA